MPLTRELQELLDNVIDSLAKWDLVNYLQKNPSNLISSEQIAEFIGRTSDEITSALTELSESKLVEYENDGAAIYYRFQPSKKWREHVAQFTQGLTDRTTRWLILNYMIEKHGFGQTQQ